MKKTISSAILAAVYAVYVIGAVITFGLVWSRINCPSDRKVDSPYEDVGCIDKSASLAMPAAMFWPLTISVLLFEEPRP